MEGEAGSFPSLLFSVMETVSTFSLPPGLEKGVPL